MGRILRARDERLRRPVALKELLRNDPIITGRFVQEAFLTARLQHPSIVPVYEAGRFPDGSPFYAMKLVSGRPLSDVIDERPSLDQRLALIPHVLAVAEAMAYAHSERIIHRDLKPQNVLVGDFGETVVIDWGLAKDLADDPPAPDQSAPPTNTPGAPPRPRRITAPGVVVGTPAYMPPEQAYGARVDERSDVYALGAILYHVLAGAPPYGDKSMTARDVLNLVAAAPPAPLEEKQRGVPKELATIARKAMARAPDDRYPTARELAEDLRRFQAGQFVRAHRYSPLALLVRFIRRHKAPLAVAASAVLVLIALGALGVRRILVERDRAEEARRQAVVRADDLTLVEARAWVSRDPNRAIAWLKSLSPAFADWGAARTIAADAEAHGIARVFLGHTDMVSAVRFSPDSRLLASSSDDRTVRLWDVETGRSRVLAGHTDEAWDIAFSPDGHTVATGSKDKTVRLWTLGEGEAVSVRVLSGHEGPVRMVKFAPDGRLLATSSDDGTVRLWDASGSAVRVIKAHEGRIFSLDFSPDGTLLVSGGKDGAVRLHRLSGGDPTTLTGHEKEVMSVSFSRDGKLVATSDMGGAVWLWDVAAGKGRPLVGHTAVARSALFLPDGKRLATIGDDATLRLWDIESEKARVLLGHGGILVSLAVSPDGSQILTGSFDHTARLWDTATGSSRVLYGSGDQEVLGVGFSPDGRWIAFSNQDGAVRLFEARPGRARVFPGHEGEVHALAFLRGGERIVSAGADGTAKLWDRNGSAPGVLSGHEGGLLHAAVSADGSRIATAGQDGLIGLWDASGRPTRVLEGHGGKINRIALSPDGKRLASAGSDGLSLWDGDAGARRGLLQGVGVSQVEFAPDDKTLAVACSDKTVRLVDLGSGEARVLGEHEAEVTALVFPPRNGSTGRARHLASGGRDHKVRVWDLENGSSRTMNMSGFVTALAFSPDEASVAAVSHGYAGVRLLDVATGQERKLSGGHESFLTGAIFSPDGRVLATSSLDKTVRLWDLASGESRVLRGHPDAVQHIAFSPDGKAIVSAGKEGSVRLFPDDLPHDPDAVRAWLSAATPETVDLRRGQ